MSISCICHDLLLHICSYLSLVDMTSLTSTCKTCKPTSDDFYRDIAITWWGMEFWKKAEARPPHVSQPLESMRKELIRMELFQRVTCVKWGKVDFMKLWENDKHRKKTRVVEVPFTLNDGTFTIRRAIQR